LARIRLIAAGGPNLQAGDLITAEPGFQAKEGRANGRRQQPDGGGHRLLGDRQQQNFDNVGGRPERDCDGVVISGHCSFRSSKRRFCGHTGSPPPNTGVEPSSLLRDRGDLDGSADHRGGREGRQHRM
jgi:hypothetical protein